MREEMHHIREGKHGARSTKQAIAVGLSKARRARVKLPPPEKGQAAAETRKHAARDYAKGRSGTAKRPSVKRSRATLKALRRESHSAASHTALARPGAPRVTGLRRNVRLPRKRRPGLARSLKEI